MQNPDIIIKKLQEVSGGLYWITLGKKKFKSPKFFMEKIKTAIAWRTMRLIGKQSVWPFFFLSHYQVLFSEIIEGFCKKLTQIKNNDWHIHMHIMDLHDCRSVNRFFHLIGRYKYFIKWAFERLKGNTKHRFIYASSLMYIDNCLKKVVDHLKKENIFDETLILVTADHGSHYAESPRKKVATGDRTYYEYLDIPFILSHKIKKNIKRDICDTMGITATFLDVLNVPFDSSYKGQSIFKNGKSFVISESAGGGNADLIRKDLYFTITTVKFKLMLLLEGRRLKINKLFNISKDPYELNNLYTPKNKLYYQNIINKLVIKVYMERKSIFTLRGIKKLDACFK